MERRLKGNKHYLLNKKAGDRENNRKLNDIENNIQHRWINLVEKRGDQTIIPHKFQIESLHTVDHKYYLILNVSRKFVPIGTKHNKYFVALDDQDDDSVESGRPNKVGGQVNKWGKKFRDVERAMAYLCYDRKIFQNEDGSQKEYTVVYEDRFMGNLETEVWRFHQEMDIPSHRVRLLKMNGQIIWDRKNKFSLI